MADKIETLNESTWINTKSPVLSVGKYARKMILKRNKEIDKLNEIIICLTKQNIRMREELYIIGRGQ